MEAILDEGHEIASHDLHHISPTRRLVLDFYQDITKSKRILESICGEKIIGYRSPNAQIDEERMLAVKRCGFGYDSSIYPCIPIPGFYGRPLAPTQPYRLNFHNLSAKSKCSHFWEFPIAVIPFFRIPAGSSWYTRNFGYRASQIALMSQMRKGVAMYYMHPYEFSDKLPRFLPVPRHTFRRTGQVMRNMLIGLLRTIASKGRFCSCRSYLDYMGTI